MIGYVIVGNFISLLICSIPVAIAIGVKAYQRKKAFDRLSTKKGK